MKKIIIPVILCASIFTFAQESTKVNDSITSKKIDEITLTGSRNKKRTVIDSPVPVDVIDVKQISRATGQVEVNQLLQFSAPSFNSNKQSGSDGADSVDPATLRGLGPDQTLVLLNGKRYHQSSLVNLFGTKGRGNTGTDMNTIPVDGIKRIEVLRDGAAAQYGSDAIAGVINVILNDRNKGFEAKAFYGLNLFRSPKGGNDIVSDKKLDGLTFDFSGNYGAKLGNKGGFINVTGEIVNKGFAIRNANPDLYQAPRQRFGDAKSNNLYLFYNAEVPLSEQTKFYSFGGYSFRDTHSYAWTRSPDADGNVPAIYPNGFNPIEHTKINDFNFNNGLKFKLADFDIDLYNSLGNNQFLYNIENTVNATLGAKSKTSFDAGGHSLLQNTTGFNATKAYSVLQGLNVAFGSEFRLEQFKIYKGEEQSYAAYDVNGNIVTPNTPANLLVTNPSSGNVRPAGSQGFPGYSMGVKQNRNNFAGYVDTELDVTKNWMVSAAARYENYSDFGSTLNGKFATRYKISNQFAFRGSISTGFRAPSLVQKYYGLNFTNFQGGKLVTIQLASNNSALAKAAGIPQLKQEKSVNGGAGFTFNSHKFTATVDGYYVKVKDRIVLTGNFDQSDSQIGQDLVNAKVDQAQFFANAIDTKTLGLDVILTYNENIGSGKLTASFAANLNDMQITSVHTPANLKGKEDVFLSARERAFILASAPKNKFNLSLNYKIEKFNVNLQEVRFDNVTLIGYNGPTDYQKYEVRYTTDLSFGYDFTKNFNFTLGMKNLFNQYPSLQKDAVSNGNTESGGIFDPVQMGFAGRQIFTRVNYTF